MNLKKWLLSRMPFTLNNQSQSSLMDAYIKGYDQGYQAGLEYYQKGLDANDGTYKRDEKGRIESLKPIKRAKRNKVSPNSAKKVTKLPKRK